MDLPDVLSASAYIRERISPVPGDRDYLCLADLLASVRRFASESRAGMRVLDYGCGGSPYRGLFQGTQYVRADVASSEGEELDYLIVSGQSLGAEAGTFDLILSTQVAEHVEHIDQYFADCLRLLKPGGLLYCSTHGHFVEHGSPNDFWRWTADGLAIAMRRAGFVVVGVQKLTTGLRALLTFVELGSSVPLPPKYTLFGFVLRIVRKLFRLLRAPIHRSCDRWLPDNRVVTSGLHGHDLYVGVVAVARRPD